MNSHSVSDYDGRIVITAMWLYMDSLKSIFQFQKRLPLDRFKFTILRTVAKLHSTNCHEISVGYPVYVYCVDIPAVTLNDDQLPDTNPSE
jgi:hypothetical protein